MKLTKSQIKQIIKEELESVMQEIEEEPLEEEEFLEQDSKKLNYDPERAKQALIDAMSQPMSGPRKK